MALTKLTANVNNIQALSDRPNEIDGLDSSALKERFDRAGATIKNYINNTLTEELDTITSSSGEEVTELAGDLSSLTETVRNLSNTVESISQATLDFSKIYPVGSIYITVSNSNPSTLFGGSWEKVSGDAYLKIVTTNAGQYGGTSTQHKIPVSSMPSHTHTVSKTAQYGRPNNANFGARGDWQGMSVVTTSATGGGQPYYPYYLGVYVWKRTS
jgi:hypothetical protein